MEQYLNESDNMKVEIEELELLHGLEDSEIVGDCEEAKGTEDLSCLQLGGSEWFLACEHVAMGKKIGRKAATGGRTCRALGDVGKTRRIMPRAQEGHQTHE